MRVIVDNDFGGDPDGLFHLAEQLLSPSCEVRGIVCSHHYKEFYRKPGHVAYAREQVQALLDVMHINDVPVYMGSDSTMQDVITALESEAARAIVNEAMRDDGKSPLYILCGAGLTNIASAYLMEPRIAERIAAVVWIGGPEYNDLCRNKIQHQREYYFGIDGKSAQVVFNHSTLKIWQFPRDVYRQCLYSYAELKYRLRDCGETGMFLLMQLEDMLKRAKGNLGEAYVLGDNPLILATALQSAWEKDAASTEYTIRQTPVINDQGIYTTETSQRPIRIFTKVDARLMLEDLIAKLQLSKKIR
ncbi:MAG: nucleoside hydrolase [Prevotella sp.]